MDEARDRAAARPEPFEPARLGAAVAAAYHNRSLSVVNDHEIRMSVMTAGFGWHVHPDSDETFLVVDGTLVVEFDEGAVVLSPGQMLTVPRGRRHRTRPGGARSVNLTFERQDAATVMEGEG